MTAPGTEDEERWEALRARGVKPVRNFVYAVVTTGIYCRPSCGARRPRAENVRFFDTPRLAQDAGFRPCKRCRPDAPAQETPDAQAIAKACVLMEAQGADVDFGEIARQAGLSRSHFQRRFREATGLTPGAWLKAVRARAVVARLGDGTVTAAIYDAGYGSSSRFYEGVAPALGLRPSDYAKGGAGERIRFAVGESWLGPVLVAATEKGICAIAFGDDAQALVRNLELRFPKAELIGGDAAFERWMAEVIGFIEAPQRGLDLPLDIKGTAFQLQVWRALQLVRPGETVSYAELAARLGLSGAARAVARACASNALAVAIPCHRVVRADGALAGYRWGVERKRLLLQREGAM
jgi:AraC family transcriptional regulator of adaptative response/methylated-DNA-[protein]-cysteine methyltransferase